jgi:hypothetical protein
LWCCVCFSDGPSHRVHKEGLVTHVRGGAAEPPSCPLAYPFGASSTPPPECFTYKDRHVDVQYPEDGKCRPTDTSPRKGYCMPTTSHLPPLPSSRDLSKPLTYHDPTVKMRVYYCMSVQFVCPWRRNPYYSDEKKVWATQPSSSGSRPSFHRFLVNLNTHSSSGK